MRFAVLSVMLLFCFCSVETPLDPQGVATWTSPSTQALVGINYADDHMGMLGDRKVNQRCDLILCDSLVKPIDTIFSNREGYEIVNLFYDQSEGYIVMESKKNSDINTVMEYVQLDGTIKQVYGMFAIQFNRMTCDRGTLLWDNMIHFFILDRSTKQ